MKVLVSIFGVAASTGLVAAYTPQGNAGTRAVFASTNIPSLSERPTGVSSRGGVSKEAGRLVSGTTALVPSIPEGCFSQLVL